MRIPAFSLSVSIRPGRKLAAIFGAAAILTAPACAMAMDKDTYRAKRAEIAALQREMLAAADALAKGMDAGEAKPLAAHFSGRLDWLRTTMTAAAIPDTATLRAKDAPPYARCLVWRTGDMEEALQDLATDLALKAKGAADTDLLPLDRAAIAALGLRKGCPD